MTDVSHKESGVEAQQIVLIVAGLFSFAGGLFGWSGFLSHRKARFFVSFLGEGGARLFYMILGVVLLVLGFGGDPAAEP